MTLPRIESNVPVPPRKGTRGWAGVAAKMLQGQCIQVPAKNLPAAHKAIQASGHKAIQRKNADGTYTVWKGDKREPAK